MTAQLVSTNHTDKSAILLVDGIRYEYFFPIQGCLDTLRYLEKKGMGRMLNYAKRYAERTQRLEHVA